METYCIGGCGFRNCGGTAKKRLIRGGALVRVQFLQEITTQGKASKVGDRERLEVADDLMVDVAM